MPNPAGFFAVAFVHQGQLEYLTHADFWSPCESDARQFITRAEAARQANRFPNAGVIARTFQAAAAGAAPGTPAQAKRAGRPRAALPPSTNRGGKSNGQGAGA